METPQLDQKQYQNLIALQQARELVGSWHDSKLSLSHYWTLISETADKITAYINK